MESYALPLTLMIALLLLAINLVAFMAFGMDKKFAQNGERRISEFALLQIAFLGGTPGAYAGRHVFRHKTRKQPFSDLLFHITLIQVLVVGTAVGWFLLG